MPADALKALEKPRIVVTMSFPSGLLAPIHPNQKR
jgi:hypothetical protein